jgi:methylmalonyl-CoA/ethylmalonyl-CoA epimerase
MSVTVKRVDRIAIAVRSLEAARAFFERHFGAAFGPVEDVRVDGYRYAPFTLGGFTIELLEPYDPASPVARFLERRGEGLYQVSFTVEDVDAAARDLRAAGLRIVGPRTYPDDHQMEGCRWKEAFVHPRDAFGVLLFLGERTPIETSLSPAGGEGRGEGASR